MKTKIAYVLVSSNDDVYLEQAYISMMSLRHHTPDAVVELLIDKETEKSLTGRRAEIIKLANKVTAIDVAGEYNAQQRSRILKTSLRNYIEGDYLFIDCDTIVTKPLDDIDNCRFDIAACQDSHSLFKDNPYRDMCVAHGKILDWPIEKENVYFNSGIIYVKDNELTRNFYSKWNEFWREGSLKHVNMDQPSFAKTNYALGHVVKILDDVWNCELKHGTKYLKDAKIVHYLCTNTDPSPLFVMNSVEELRKIKNGNINPLIIKCFDDPFVGLTNVSQLICGDDMFVYRSRSYLFLKNHKGSWAIRLFESGLKFKDRLKGKLKRIVKGLIGKK